MYKTDKKLLQEYAAFRATQYNSTNDWVSYFIKKTGSVAKINGMYHTIEKPTIKTSFCFSYGMNGTSVGDDYIEADRQAEQAKRDIDGFMTENLEELLSEYNAIKYYVEKGKPLDTADYDSDDRKNVYSRHQHQPYFNKPYEGEYGFTYMTLGDCLTYKRSRGEDSLVKMTVEDATIVLSQLEEIIETFKKRLNTYLKRFGLTKIRTWTYLSD